MTRPSTSPSKKTAPTAHMSLGVGIECDCAAAIEEAAPDGRFEDVNVDARDEDELHDDMVGVSACSSSSA